MASIDPGKEAPIAASSTCFLSGRQTFYCQSKTQYRMETIRMYLAVGRRSVILEANQYGPVLWTVEIGHEKCSPSLDSRITRCFFPQLHKKEKAELRGLAGYRGS